MPELALNGVMMITARAETRVSPRRIRGREKPYLGLMKRTRVETYSVFAQKKIKKKIILKMALH